MRNNSYQNISLDYLILEESLIDYFLFDLINLVSSALITILQNLHVSFLEDRHHKEFHFVVCVCSFQDLAQFFCWY